MEEIGTQVIDRAARHPAVAELDLPCAGEAVARRFQNAAPFCDAAILHAVENDVEIRVLRGTAAEIDVVGIAALREVLEDVGGVHGAANRLEITQAEKEAARRAVADVRRQESALAGFGFERLVKPGEEEDRNSAEVVNRVMRHGVIVRVVVDRFAVQVHHGRGISQSVMNESCRTYFPGIFSTRTASK